MGVGLCVCVVCCGCVVCCVWCVVYIVFWVRVGWVSTVCGVLCVSSVQQSRHVFVYFLGG